ncbi:MAG TPA: hypothetical protein VE396_08290 [Xanthobacteraceae bacterium]|jgi:hypothetical protein|nr:hypothetical protein [Xanthobacteraceae bacterium]
MASAAASAKQRGRPYPPGVSGNLAGRPSAAKRYHELFDALSADLGGDLGAIDRAMLEQACRLMGALRIPKTIFERWTQVWTQSPRNGKIRDGQRGTALLLISLVKSGFLQRDTT